MQQIPNNVYDACPIRQVISRFGDKWSMLVLSTLDIGHMMLHVAGLSFLGLGVQPPTPEWGSMINDARQYLWTQPQLLLYPGLAIFVSVMAFNLLGDAMRDASDFDFVEAES